MSRINPKGLSYKFCSLIYQKVGNIFSPNEVFIILSLAYHKHLIVPNKDLSDPGS